MEKDDTQTPAAPAAEPQPAAEVETLRAELERDRFEAAGARAGLVDAYGDVALEMFKKTGQPATKEAMAAYLAGLKKTSPALFAGAGATTAPASSAPAAPAAAPPSSALTKWRALRAAGLAADAHAFYQRNRAAILAS